MGDGVRQGGAIGLAGAAVVALVVVLSSAPAAGDGTRTAVAPFLARAVTMGQSHVCAILGNGSVKCWGDNPSGALGLGDTVSRGDGPGQMGTALPAVDLGTGRTATAISAGTNFTCAILDDGSVKCWGYNNYGQLGQGDTATRGDQTGEMGDDLHPVDLGTGRTAIAIATGHAFACAVLDDGTVKCWGRNQYGQLGQGDFRIRGDQPDEMGDDLPPIDLGTGRTAVDVSAGGNELLDHVCALLDDASVKCWGLRIGSNAALASDKIGGHPGDMGDHLAPVPLGTGHTVTALSTGMDHACAILDDGTLKCWGRGEFGVLGFGDTAWRYQPADLGDSLPTVALGTGRHPVAIATSTGNASCAILDDGSVKCWGRNDAGQLGLGDTSAHGSGPGQMGDDLPVVELGTGRRAVAITMGRYAACAALDDGSLRCWGLGPLGLGGGGVRGDEPTDMGDNLPAVDLGMPAAPTAVLSADGPVGAGSPIPTHLTITNPGSGTLHGIQVEDANAPSCATVAPFDLGPGADITLDCSQPTLPGDVGGTVTNEATVTSDETWPVRSNTSSVAVVTPAPGMTASLVAEETEVVTGDAIHYHLTLANTGNTVLTGVTVTDPAVTDCAGPVADLALGAVTTVDCEYTPVEPDDVGTFTNAATADSDQTDPVTTDDVDVAVIARHQPDATIRVAGGARQGDGVYNADAAGQRVVVSRAPSAGATFYVQLQNDGAEDDVVDLRRFGAAAPGLRVRYFTGRSNDDITADVLARTWRSRTLAPHESTTVRVEVTVRAGASTGTAGAITLRSRSQGGTTQLDTVVAKVRIRS